MKKIGELLKKKQWKWMAAGMLCLTAAVVIFALASGTGVRAENVELGNATIDLAKDGSDYLITTADQFNALRNATADQTKDKKFILQNDLSITPAGAANGTFEGIFDGNGHVLTITASTDLGLSSSGAGTVSEGLLFGTVKGTVQNLIVDVQRPVVYNRTTAPGTDATSPVTTVEPTDPGNAVTAPYSGSDKFSSQSTDADAKALAEKLDAGTDSDLEKITVGTDTYYQVKKPESVTKTSTYQVNSPAGTDSFGIICGTLESNASVVQVYVKGQTLAISQWAGQIVTGQTQTGTADRYFYYKQMTVTAEGQTTSYEYEYVENPEDTTNFPKYGNETYTADATNVTKTAEAGNALDAGIIAGTSKGTVTQVKQDMAVTGKKSEGNTAEQKLGGIAGVADTGASASDLYILGTQSYSADSTAAVTNAVYQNGVKPESENWTSYEKYTSATATETAFDLAWLVVKETDAAPVFTYTLAESDKKITVGLAAGKNRTSKNLSYSIAYNARKTMSDAVEDTVYYTSDDAMELGDSGYYRLLSTYATDGYYHYTNGVTELADAEVQYPYDPAAPYTITEQKVVCVTEASSWEDRIQITFSGSVTGGTVYYEPASTLIPNGSSEKETIGTDGTVKLPFEMDTVTYRITPVISGRIYQTQTTNAFTQADRTVLPAPSVTCFDYYDANGSENTYQAFDKSKSYEAGTAMKLTPGNDTDHAKQYTLRYLFSAESLGADAWSADRYTGSADIMAGASEYVDQALIPETMTGNIYLYVEVSKDLYNKQIYRYGAFQVTERCGVNVSVNGTAQTEQPAGYRVVLKDVVTLAASQTGRTLSYELRAEASQSHTWSAYTASGITAADQTKSYLYVRIQYADGKFGEPQLFTLDYGSASAKPTITPQTGLAENGADAAASIEQTTQIRLSSATTNAHIFYVTGASKTDIALERTQAPSANVSDGETVSGYKYFQIGQRWYRTANLETERYGLSTKIYLTHTNLSAKNMYVSAAAVAEDYEISEEKHYIYEVQAQKKAEDPQAGLVTYFAPGGQSNGKMGVVKGGKLSFYCATSGVTLYYATGGDGSSLTDVIPSDGVEVTGKYGEEFVVWVQARATNENIKSSNVVKFVYVINAQETVNAPTATPGTSTTEPTTVIPGNKILLSTTTKGASIFYTTNGYSPSVSYDEQTGTFGASAADTSLYDSTKGIEMPAEGSGYFTITAIAVKQGFGNSQEVRFPYIYPDAVQTPYATVGSGKVELNTQVFLKNLTSGATIYYNAAYGANVKEADVADPTLSSVVYSESYSFTITQRTVIKAMAVKDGVKSAVLTLVYDPLAQLAAPKASIESGSVVSSGTVLHLTAASGAGIYYTIDGSDPTDASNAAVMLGNSVTLHGDAGGQITVKAYAKAENSSQSEVAVFTYQFSQNATGGVTASVASGSTVSNGTKIILMSDLTNAEIYYTTNGESPVDHGTKGTTVEVNGTPGASFTVKAVAVSNKEPGIVATFIYKIREKPEKPTASPAGGTLTVAVRVSLDSAADQIYYTTDGTEPTKSSNLYSEAVLINRTTNLKAVAVSEDGEMSEVASFYYTAAAKAAMPRADQESGQVLEPGSVVKLTSDTADAQIYYTTDGTDPTVNDLDHLLVYDEEGIRISRSVTIKAVSYTEDLRMSNVSSFDYIVDTIPAVEMKKAEAEKLAEEGLKDTDASALSRKNEAAETKKLRCELENETISVFAQNHAKTLFGDDHEILAQYQVRLKSDSTDGEISLPIPDGYENATLTAAALDSEHKLTTLESRREDGMLYIRASSAGDYVIVGPAAAEEGGRKLSYILPLELTAGAVLLAGAGYCGSILWKKRKMSKKTTQTSDEL